MKAASGLSRMRGLSIGLVLLGSVLVGLIPLPFLPDGIGNASATNTTIRSDADLDGRIAFFGTTYPPSTQCIKYNTTASLPVGQMNGSGDIRVDRSYLSFNTSELPTDAIVLSVNLRVRAYFDMSDIDFNVWAWHMWYPEWPPDVTRNDTFGMLGTLLNTASFVVGNWYSMSLSSSIINATGFTQILLNSSRDGNTPPADFTMPPYSTIEEVGFYSGDSSSPPELVIDYILAGTPVFIELDPGGWTTWLNSTAFPEISEWNLTYDLYLFSIDTVPNSKNITIWKLNASWTFKSVVPACNYTETDTELLLSDVYDSICYRIWFTVPKSNPYSTIHLSLYNAFTGEGFFWELMRVQICDGAVWDNTTAETVARPDFNVEPDASYTLRVLDYFGNALIDYSFVASAQDVYVSIPVPTYSWQIFNMNDAPILMRIYWNNSGSPWEFFVGPHWIIERFLKGGEYTFMVTFYNTDGTAGETVYFNRTVPMTGLNASFVYVTGTSLYEIISTIEGMMATQAIITSLISPSIVLIYEDLPLAPVKLKALTLTSPLAIDPYLILETTTYQNRTTTAGVNATLWRPYPSVVGATYYVLSDVLSFSGTFASTIYINQTDGTNLYYNTILPATVNLQGQNVTVWANNAFAVSRATVWREITEYTVNYYATEKRYEATLALNNSGGLDFYAPYWFVGFPNMTTIDTSSVRVFDLDNGIYLSEHTNFEVSSGGIHLTMNQLNASAQRNLRFTYYDLNSTTGLGAPNLVAEAYTQGTLNGISMKYTAVQWTNPWGVAYRGEVYITLNFTGGDNLLPASMTVIDETTGNVIPNSQWIYTGRTIIILTDGVGTVPVGGARNYGIYFTFGGVSAEDERHDFFFGPIVVNGQQFYISGQLISWAMIVMLVGWVLVFWAYWTERRDITSYFIIWGSVTIVLMYFQAILG